MLLRGQNWTEANDSRHCDLVELDCRTCSAWVGTFFHPKDSLCQGWIQQIWMWWTFGMLPTFTRGMEGFWKPFSSSWCELLFLFVIHLRNFCYHKGLPFCYQSNLNQQDSTCQVIPIFDVITMALEDHIEKDTLPLIVHHAALRGYYMLNKHYLLTDDSVVYRIAMSRSFMWLR